MLKPQVVAVGGGHGLAATILAIRRYAGRTTAVVATADDGGSTGRLRDTMELPAPGDVRHCLVAMAATGQDGGSAPLVDALEYRFDGTDVAGHALGNLLLAGLTAVTGDFVAAVDEASRLLGLDPEVARVLPATAEPVVLRATLDGGGGEGELTGQVAISRAGSSGSAWNRAAPGPRRRWSTRWPTPTRSCWGRDRCSRRCWPLRWSTMCAGRSPTPGAG